MKLVFLGPPGAGKGTQAKILAKKLEIPHISTGDIFRENIKQKTDLGKKASQYMNQGNLVPDEITNAMVEGKLADIEGYILDGYPRTIPQAEFLDSIEDIDKVIDFQLSKREAVRRISGRRTCLNCGTAFHVDFKPPKKEGICDKCSHELIQRKDEKPEVVEKRFDEYHEKTNPLVDYYNKQDKLNNVDASPSIEEIAEKVEKLIK